MKLHVTAEMDFHSIERYLDPVREYCTEKRRRGMYDDWDEAAHSEKWLREVLASPDAGELDIYYLEEKGEVIGSLFVLSRGRMVSKSLRAVGAAVQEDTAAQLTCFHIIERKRGAGIGSTWLRDEVFPELRNRGIELLYIKSSHHSALKLYDRLGERIGHYIGISDHGLYERYGYIYRIKL